MKRILVALVLAAVALGVYAKTVNVPALQVEDALRRARTFVQEKKVDVSHAFIGRVEYLNLHSEYEKPCWRVTWMAAAGTAQGATFVNVFEDGTVTVAAE